ncbi:hypothetical protein DICPUDRAFT_153420 [Dictyostelium purpureum]|uniref:START domain-containing protein n=1 Tax=Dictyostelium purpureum TaxID=5786 RepID=F0ZNV2_DICPU|nr:uncharacterized protein DICPUDRAFT_153420 [Dictyostelium purpureum]EGC34372.1 hypothetical protein DICPUDRAFT_153420 [Dictyostelium purpureum]|eukprot:XP_003289106.1 hypothetical protein DICPUDRAFT_153420 [Dictyostelium purpureum]
MDLINYSTIAASLVGAGVTYALLKGKNNNNSSCGIEFPDVALKRWENLNNGYKWEQFLEDIKELDDPSQYKEVLDECLEIKRSGEHYKSLMLFNRVLTTIQRLKNNKNVLFNKINDYIEENKPLRVMRSEATQLRDCTNAFLSEEGGWKVDNYLTNNVLFSYRNNGRQLKSRKFIKVIDKPMKNLACRAEEIQFINTWKWYQTGTLLDNVDGTQILSFISILSKFFILNRAAYCWKVSYFLPDGSLVIAYNGANNRQEDYDLPPLPENFAKPDIFYHAFRFIPLTPERTIVISVLWSRIFGSRELVLMDDNSNYIKGTEFEDFVNTKPIYKQIDETILNLKKKQQKKQNVEENEN